MKTPHIFLSLLAAASCNAGIYSDIEFGDDSLTVTEKLQASDLVTELESNSIFGLPSLNGKFLCKQQLAGLDFSLHFKWSSSNTLEELTLRSTSLPLDQYNTELETAWASAKELLIRNHESPIKKNKFPPVALLKGDKVIISDVWENKKDSSNQSKVMLGTGKQDNKCFLVIRFKP